MMRLAQGTNAFWLFSLHHKCNTQNDFCLSTSSTLNGLNSAPGLYTVKGQQTKLGEPTDVKSIEKMMSTKARDSIHRH